MIGEGSSSKSSRCKLCTKAASFGMPNGKREYCSSHKRPGNIYLKHNPGEEEINLAKISHVPHGLDYSHSEICERVDIHHTAIGSNRQMCHVSGCHRAPSYGYIDQIPGTVQATSCSSHRRPGEIFLKHPQNSAEVKIQSKCKETHVPLGLMHTPNTSIDDDRIKHHNETAEQESNRALCHKQGCTKAASYNFGGCEEALYCFSHKSPTMRIVHHLHQAPGMGKNFTSSVRDDHSSKGESHVQCDEDELKKHHSTGISRDTTILANIKEGLHCVEISKRNFEDSTFAIKYLANIVKHPSESRYRIIKKSNPKFMNNVWLNPGLRGLFQAIGFREYEHGVLELVSKSNETREAIIVLSEELCKGQRSFSDIVESM